MFVTPKSFCPKSCKVKEIWQYNSRGIELKFMEQIEPMYTSHASVQILTKSTKPSSKSVLPLMFGVIENEIYKHVKQESSHENLPFLK